MKMTKKLLSLLGLITVITGCSDADLALDNNKTAAENYEINREILFYNTFTDTVILKIQGYCSFENLTNQIDVTCKRKEVAPGVYDIERYTMTKSDNSLMVQRQLEPSPTGVYNPRWIFKPGAIVPSVEVKTK